MPLLPPLQPADKIKPMYEGLAQEGTPRAARATAYLRRERAEEGYEDDPQ